MGATVQTGETSPRAAVFAGLRETAQATRSASASKNSASVAVEELPEERQDHESRDFDSLLGMVIDAGRGAAGGGLGAGGGPGGRADGQSVGGDA